MGADRQGRDLGTPEGDRAAPVRLLRVIARLNVGGPAIQAIALTARLAPRDYVTTLVRGREAASEGTMDDLAQALGVEPVLVDSLRRDPGWRDIVALVSVVRLVRRERPDLIHTHAAKAGTLGRVAAIIAAPWRARRPVLVHTFHGHSLTGYFSAAASARYLMVERVLARCTDRLIAVSAEVRDELVALGVAPAERFEVIPLGLDLARFSVDDAQRARARAAIRSELGIEPGTLVVTLVARAVPIKRIDRFLRACGRLLDLDAAFLVVGDGELRPALAASEAAVRLGERLIWTGFRRDIPEICFATDVAVLTSDNEGTPVSLIEAAAAGVPSVSTAVGGAASVVRSGATGILVPASDEDALVQAVRGLLRDPEMRATMGAAAREHALARFPIDRLIDDLDRLYRTLLASRGRR